LGSNNSDLALVAKGKQPYKGKQWDKSKGGKFQAKQKDIQDCYKVISIGTRVGGL